MAERMNPLVTFALTIVFAAPVALLGVLLAWPVYRVLDRFFTRLERRRG